MPEDGEGREGWEEDLGLGRARKGREWRKTRRDERKTALLRPWRTADDL
jgi:hypothetical protein